MTYKEQFIVEIKCNNRILRTLNNVVYLPFGSEYSIFMKNLNSVRASVLVTIDGQDVLDNNKLIISPNSSIDLQGFMKYNQVTNNFKFIQKTKQIQDYRGDRIDDGLIRVEFAFEKQVQPVIIHEYHHVYHNYTFHNNDPFHWNYGNTYSGVSSSDKLRGMSGEAATYSVNSCNVSHEINTPQVDEGITVKGNETKQNFSYTTFGDTDTAQVIVFQLKGISDSGNQVKEELTVKSKLICQTCGHSNKSSFKYCTNCGTFLE